MSRWRLVGLVGCLAAVVVAALALASGGGGKERPLPEGGSSFHSEGRTAGGPVTLLDALAPVLDQAGEKPGARPARGLPASQPRAAARLFLIGFGGTAANGQLLHRIAAREWGGIVLQNGNGTSPQQVAGLVDTLSRAARQAGHRTPIMAASQPGGDGDAVPVGSPPLAQIAGEPNPQVAARAVARDSARALEPLGIRMVFGPVADVGVAGGAWAGLAYSDAPSVVGELSAAAVQGYNDGHVAAVPGHFPGEGSASGNPSLEPATVGQSLVDLRRFDLQAFRPLASAPAIQLSSATYVAFDGVTPATLLPAVVKMLRTSFHFGGVVVSGDLPAASLATGKPVPELAVEALKAGCDMVWIPGDAADQDAAWRAVVRAMRSGDLPVTRVADALTRISVLRAKYGVR